MLDVGIVGTGVIFWLFSKLFYPMKRDAVTNCHGNAILWIFLVKIFIFGSPGNPIPFIALLLVYRWVHFNNMKKV
jgi:hypothetical protein